MRKLKRVLLALILIVVGVSAAVLVTVMTPLAVARINALLPEWAPPAIDELLLLAIGAPLVLWAVQRARQRRRITLD